MGNDFDVDIFIARPNGVSWRIYERECMEKYFGQSAEQAPDDLDAKALENRKVKYVYWKLHTESTDKKLLQRCCDVARNLPNVKHINDPRAWMGCHAKEVAFDVWQRTGIPCPRWYEFTNLRDLLNKNKFGYPFLVRLNNSTSAWFSYLVHGQAQLENAIKALEQNKEYHHDKIPNTGVNRKFIAVEYITTTRPENLNMSFRIIVGGNRVAAGYARLAPSTDWVAITNRFGKSMEQPFVKYQKVCQDFCEKNEELIVKAVKCLGLNLQGVDVILDQQNRPYFIEVQPGFSVGYPNRSGWRPPFYNPSRPPELIEFLHKNYERLKKEIPFYVNCWLDKYNMFDRVWSGIKEDLG